MPSLNVLEVGVFEIGAVDSACLGFGGLLFAFAGFGFPTFSLASIEASAKWRGESFIKEIKDKEKTEKFNRPCHNCG